ncbi:tol-pal system protein YbgF [Caulobacter sp. NIBR2454]|uniref:tol-pal system protein YbgF n=1 Tax=Caulobacter sp. NIBR2454 TaxID=3015996 RepID=UPI0022B6B678|nr:tol-pal system protein YbgF [Caulobacter sp. NIBR2454]
MKLKSAAFAVLLATSALTSAAAIAQTPLPLEADPLDDRSARRVERMEKVVRELRSIVFQGRDTGKPVVVQPAETEAMIQTMATRVTDLEESLTRLNSQNETLGFDLTQAKREASDAKAQVAALTERLNAMEQKLAAATVAPAMAEPGEPGGLPMATDADPEAAFQSARQLLLNGDYDGAERAFAGFVEQHGDSPKGAEGRYWLAETLYVRQAYADAAGAYIGAIRGWPKTAWAPDAVVKLARSLAAMNRAADACKTLDELPKRYPNASAAVKSRAATTRTQAKCA